MTNPVTLRTRIVKASIWMLSGYGASQALRLASNLIMTRLLVPEMFGIMAMAQVILTGLSLFSDMGLNANIIQHQQGNRKQFLNTVWTVQIIRGVLIWILFILLASFISIANNYDVFREGTVFTESVLPFIMIGISFTALITGLQSTKLAEASRQLSIGLTIRIELISQIVGLLTMISLAIIHRSIWALVFGALVTCSTKTILSHILLPGNKNKLHWDSSAFRQIIDFGKWVFLSSIFGFLAVNVDKFILGSLVDTASLGLYSIAVLLVKTVQLAFEKLISGVSFPSISEVIRERPADLKKTYYKFRKVIDAATLTVCGFIFMTGQFIVALLYDPRYQESGRMLEILSLLLIMVRFKLVEQCSLALGKPRDLISIRIVKLTVLLVLMPTTYFFYGLLGAIWAIPIAELAALPIFIFLKFKYQIFKLNIELIAILYCVIGIIFGYLFNQIVDTKFWLV